MLPHRLQLALPAVALALLLGGCGSDEEPSPAPAPVSAEVADCREQWRDLGEQIADRDAASTPSTLPSRWTSVAATVDYYATSARKDDCAERLSAQRESIRALEAFSVSLRRWDLEHQLTRVDSAARAYAAAPRPPAVKGKKGRKAARPPRPADVAAARTILEKQAPLASAQQRAGWQQAAATDLGDRAAVARARRDLQFLSSESPAYRKGAAALRVIEQAIAKAG